MEIKSFAGVTDWTTRPVPPPAPSTLMPLAIGARIRRDYKSTVPVAVPATITRYGKRGWFVADSDTAGTFYYMRGDGRVQQWGSGYKTLVSDVTLEVL